MKGLSENTNIALGWDELSLPMVHSRSTGAPIQATKIDCGGPKEPLLGVPPSL